ncbi:MAG: hypothetical protein DRP79_00240 [Planctomycetota bacterium]|nr:MAG: hypothetical protein DRP79_00240 [Planctomycetota bacterium]
MSKISGVFAVAFVFIVAACFAGRQAAAEDSNLAARVKSLEETVTNLRQELARVKGSVSEMEQSPPASEEKLEKWFQKAVEENAELFKSPKWLKGLKISGDLRLRYEGRFYKRDEKRERNRGRFRLRVQLEKEISDELLVGFRLASGSSSDATSTNQTFTSTFSEKSIWIDRAYVIYKPKWLKGLTLGGGKWKNPFVHTDLVWDSDVNPEGAYESFKYEVCNGFTPFITLGQMMVQENKGALEDANLMAYQAGFDLKLADSVKLTFAGTFYNFLNYEEAGNFPKADGNTSKSGGRLTAEDFNVLNLTTKVKFKVGRLPFEVYGDYVKNLGEKEVGTGSNEDKGLAVGFKIGKAKKKGTWEVGYKYARIEANAAPGALNDSDFGHSDTRGHKVGFKYAVHDKVTFGVTGLFTEPIVADDSPKTTLQVDIVLKF